MACLLRNSHRIFALTDCSCETVQYLTWTQPTNAGWGENRRVIINVFSPRQTALSVGWCMSAYLYVLLSCSAINPCYTFPQRSEELKCRKNNPNDTRTLLQEKPPGREGKKERKKAKNKKLTWEEVGGAFVSPVGLACVGSCYQNINEHPTYLALTHKKIKINKWEETQSDV